MDFPEAVEALRLLLPEWQESGGFFAAPDGSAYVAVCTWPVVFTVYSSGQGPVVVANPDDVGVVLAGDSNAMIEQ